MMMEKWLIVLSHQRPRALVENFFDETLL